ncbi:spore coat associated protein CotJA [Anaerovorax odorimutans]
MSSNKEPYVGMPIYLDDCDCDDFMDDILGDRPQIPPCMAGRPFEDWPVAMTYVPMQPWEETYEPAKALQVGTIFPSLNLQFLGGKRP